MDHDHTIKYQETYNANSQGNCNDSYNSLF
jgi:hypothetical protein